MTLKRCAVVLCAVLGGAACDLVAGPGQTLTLGDGGNVFGTGGNAQRGPLPAVTVQPTGTVVVRNSSLFGGGILVQQPNQRAFLFAGAGIDVTDGTVRVEQGLVAGGPLVLQVPATAFDFPEVGIVATGASFIDILGGTVRGGSFISQVGTEEGGEAASGIDILGGGLRVSGGTISPGVVDPPIDDGNFDFSVTTSGTEVEILGGNFTGGVGFGDGRARISGGTFRFLFVLNEDGQACAELRGGQINEFVDPPGIVVSNGARVIVAGTGLTLTPTDSSGRRRLTGTLQNGQPINASVVTSTGGVVQLVGPGGPGCP